MRIPRLLIIISLIALSLLAFMGMALAQDAAAPLIFATNTPSAPPIILPTFATNTPKPSLESLLPDTTFDRYALRLWDEPALTNLLLSEIAQLRPGDNERKMAIRILQFELKKRFPIAPRDPAVRQQLIDVMLNAPRGSIDMRAIVRPFIESGLNETQPSFAGTSSFDYQGFDITLMPANLNGDGVLDAIVQTRYPAGAVDPAEIRYQDFVVAIVDEDGVYRVLDADSVFPAAPLDDIQNISLERLGDLNGDGLDDLAISVKGRDVNQQLTIYGWRNNGIANLVEPGQIIQFGAITNWPPRSTAFTVAEYRVESPAWNCVGERDVTWAWRFNFFRPPEELGDFDSQNHLACLLYGAEPFFAQPVSEAINNIEMTVPLASPADEAAIQRAAMTIAMLRVLNGDISEALDQVRGLQASAQPGTWLADQTEAFLTAAEQSNSTPLKLCAALQDSNAYGACDVDQVLTRLFEEQPLSREQSIQSQLAQLGIDVMDSRVITEVGKLNREAVHFFLGGDHWWAFAPLEEDTYIAEKIDPPAGALFPTPAPPVIDPPDSAYRAFLGDGNPATTLNILDNTVRTNPNSALASSGYFLQALSYDLLGDRTSARVSYFTLWSADPQSIWGQLAAAHLEKR